VRTKSFGLIGLFSVALGILTIAGCGKSSNSGIADSAKQVMAKSTTNSNMVPKQQLQELRSHGIGGKK